MKECVTWSLPPSGSQTVLRHHAPAQAGWVRAGRAEAGESHSPGGTGGLPAGGGVAEPSVESLPLEPLQWLRSRAGASPHPWEEGLTVPTWMVARGVREAWRPSAQVRGVWGPLREAGVLEKGGSGDQGLVTGDGGWSERGRGGGSGEARWVLNHVDSAPVLAGGVRCPHGSLQKWPIHEQQHWKGGRREGAEGRTPRAGHRAAHRPTLPGSGKQGPSSPGSRDRERSVFRVGGEAEACMACSLQAGHCPQPCGVGSPAPRPRVGSSARARAEPRAAQPAIDKTRAGGWLGGPEPRGRGRSA